MTNVLYNEIYNYVYRNLQDSEKSNSIAKVMIKLINEKIEEDPIKDLEKQIKILEERIKELENRPNKYKWYPRTWEPTDTNPYIYPLVTYSSSNSSTDENK